MAVNPILKEQKGTLAAHAQLLADTQYTREEHQTLCDSRNTEGIFSFNMEKFQRWVWNKLKKEDVSLISNSIFTRSDYSIPIEQLNMTVNQFNQSHLDRYVIKKSRSYGSGSFWYITDENEKECGVLFADKKGNLLSETDYSKRTYNFIARLQAKETGNTLKTVVPK
ncbi:MAG: hypothetical protein Q8M03_09150 [Legionella sp.]|nr:hypothetical protein [Legionella sp.]